jgi:hypothetical protein
VVGAARCRVPHSSEILPTWPVLQRGEIHSAFWQSCKAHEQDVGHRKIDWQRRSKSVHKQLRHRCRGCLNSDDIGADRGCFARFTRSCVCAEPSEARTLMRKASLVYALILSFSGVGRGRGKRSAKLKENEERGPARAERAKEENGKERERQYARQVTWVDDRHFSLFFLICNLHAASVVSFRLEYSSTTVIYIHQRDAHTVLYQVLLSVALDIR